jgi:hypothetical protein
MILADKYIECKFTPVRLEFYTCEIQSNKQGRISVKEIETEHVEIIMCGWSFEVDKPLKKVFVFVYNY